MRRPGAAQARRSGFRGIGGGSAPAEWTPASLSSLTLWLKGGTDLVQVAGPKVSAWGDQSSAGNDFTQAVDGNRPTPTTLNGITCPAFVAGGAQRLIGANTFGSYCAAGAGEILYVVHDVGGGAGSYPIVGCPSLSKGIATRIDVSAPNVQALAYDPAVRIVSFTPAAASPWVVCVRWDGVNVTLEAGGSSSSTACGPLADMTDVVWVAGSEVVIGEVIMSNAVLSASDRASAKAYLAARFGANP